MIADVSYNSILWHKLPGGWCRLESVLCLVLQDICSPTSLNSLHLNSLNVPQTWLAHENSRVDFSILEGLAILSDGPPHNDLASSCNAGHSMLPCLISYPCIVPTLMCLPVLISHVCSLVDLEVAVMTQKERKEKK